jgi:hypothetical protein
VTTGRPWGKWRRIAGLADDMRPGKPRTMDNGRVARLIKTTLHTKPVQRIDHFVCAQQVAAAVRAPGHQLPCQPAWSESAAVDRPRPRLPPGGLRRCVPGPGHHTAAHPRLSSTDQRQGRALHPAGAARLGMRRGRTRTPGRAAPHGRSGTTSTTGTTSVQASAASRPCPGCSWFWACWCRAWACVDRCGACNAPPQEITATDR